MQKRHQVGICWEILGHRAEWGLNLQTAEPLDRCSQWMRHRFTGRLATSIALHACSPSQTRRPSELWPFAVRLYPICPAKQHGRPGNSNPHLRPGR